MSTVSKNKQFTILEKEIKMNTNQLQFRSLLTNRSFQICLILGLVLLALFAAHVSDLSAGSTGDLAGRKPPMPAVELQDAEDHLAGKRTPMPQPGLPEQGIFMAGRRPPMPGL
jgi:hypothetical protein